MFKRSDAAPMKVVVKTDDGNQEVTQTDARHKTPGKEKLAAVVKQVLGVLFTEEGSKWKPKEKFASLQENALTS